MNWRKRFMGKIKILKCDRCGEEIDPLISDNQLVDYDVVEVTAYSTRTSLDLCPKCKAELYHWIWNYGSVK